MCWVTTLYIIEINNTLYSCLWKCKLCLVKMHLITVLWLSICACSATQSCPTLCNQGALHRKGERKSRFVPPFPESPRCLCPFQGNLFPCTTSTFKPRIDSHHGGTWDSTVGKPRGKASRESHRSLDPLDGKHDTAATAREESARACPHSKQGLTPLGRLQKYPKIHVSTGEESSGSGTDSTQGLRAQHRRERKPQWPPRGPRATHMGIGLS